jgi:hypothetical protein
MMLHASFTWRRRYDQQTADGCTYRYMLMKC